MAIIRTDEELETEVGSLAGGQQGGVPKVKPELQKTSEDTIQGSKDTILGTMDTREPQQVNDDGTVSTAVDNTGVVQTYEIDKEPVDADVNDDGVVDLSDPTESDLFFFGPPPEPGDDDFIGPYNPNADDLIEKYNTPEGGSNDFPSYDDLRGFGGRGF